METKLETTFTCPWWLIFTFENPLRKLMHDPVKIISPFIKPGIVVIWRGWKRLQDLATTWALIADHHVQVVGNR